MDALEPLLRPVVALINRRIRTTTPALDLCADLAGRTIAIRLDDTALAAYALVDPDGVRLVGQFDADPDVIISGSPLALASLGGADPRAAFRDGRLEIAGDAEIANAFQRLMELARPDLEEEASRFFGDAAAHRLAETLRDLVSWGKETVQNFGDSLGEQVSGREDLPTREEAESFAADVRDARDAAARLEARIKKLAQRSAG